MEEYFSWDNLPFKFLFDSWNVASTTTLVFTAIGVFCIALFYESLKVFIEALNKSFFALPLVVDTSTNLNSLLSDSIIVSDSVKHVRKQRITNHCLQTIVHVIKVAFGYALMLSVMSYNGYIAIALLLGATLGYFIFGHKINHTTNSSRSSSTAVSTVTSQTNIANNDNILQPSSYA